MSKFIHAHYVNMANNNGNLNQEKENKVNPDNFSDIIEIQEETKAGIDNLRSSTIDSSLSRADTKSDLAVHQAGLEYERGLYTLEGFMSALNKLLQDIDDIRKGISKKKLSKAGKKTMDKAKVKLKQYEKNLKGKKEALMKSKTEISDNDVAHLRHLWQEIENVKEDIKIGQRGEFSSTASYLYNSPENVKKANKHQKDAVKFKQKLWAEGGGGMNGSGTYGRRAYGGNGMYGEREEWGDSTYGTKELGYGGTEGGSGGGENPGRSVELRTSKTADYSNLDFGETFKQGGITGVIDKALSNCNNLTPGQRETWKNLGVLACVAGSIYGLYKFYTNKKMSFWTKAGITVGTIFGSEVLLGETPLSLFNKLMTGGLSLDELSNKFGNAISGLGSSGGESQESISGTGGESVSETIVPAMYSMMIFNSSTKVKDIRTMTETFKDPNEGNKNRQIFYEQSCNKLKEKHGTQAMEYFRDYFSGNFDEEKWKNRLSSFGVSDSTDEKESLYGLANNATMNKIILEKFESENGLIVTNKNALEAYKKDKMEKNEAIDVDDLKKHINENGEDRFKIDEKRTHTEREEDIQNKKSLGNQVDQLPLNEQRKSELKQALEIFYDERSIETKPKLNDFSLKMGNGLIILTSHSGYKTKIDLNKKELVGFGKKSDGSGENIKFTNLSDLLNATDLTNKILESQKGKTPKSMPPFQYKQRYEGGKMGRGIYFNDASTRSFNFDTRVLSGGWGGAIGKIGTLCDHPEEYAEYLSKRWMELNPETSQQK